MPDNTEPRFEDKDTPSGLIPFITSGTPSPPMTREDWDKAIDSFIESEKVRYNRRPVQIVSRRQHVVMEVSSRPEAWQEVRRPWKERIRAAWRVFTYRDEAERRDWDWRWALRELRRSTKQVLSSGAVSEIQRRWAEMARPK